MPQRESLMEKVSVIIPVFNRSKLIHQTISSVIKQTYSNFEIIIIDDFSTDYEDLVKVVDSFNDNRIVLLRNSCNMNGAYSRNVGIKKASGKYIAFLDSDDTWHKDKIQKQVSLAESLNGRFIITCYSNVIRRNFEDILPKKPIIKDEPVTTYLFTNNGYIPTPSIFLLSSLAKENLFNETLKRHQDYDFLLRVQKKGAIFYTIQEPLVTVYANHPERSEQRGAKYEISEKFLIDYAEYFDIKSSNYFWLKNVAFYKSRAGKKTTVFKELFLCKKYTNVTIKDIFTHCVYFLVVNTPVYNAVETIYSIFLKKKRKGNL